MKREIYEVYAKVVDANGAYNTLSGYPKTFDSHYYNDNIEKARVRAYGEFHSCIGTLCTRDDRQCQFAMIIRASDGMQIEKVCLGTVADLPDPTYTVTIVNGSGSGDYTEGQTVTINANEPEEGKVFAHWDCAETPSFTEGNINTPFARFIMPSHAISMTAIYEDAEVEPEGEPEIEPGEG